MRAPWCDDDLAERGCRVRRVTILAVLSLPAYDCIVLAMQG